MFRNRGKLAIALAMGAAACSSAVLGACASSAPDNAPQWYLDHLAAPQSESYPRLEDVPRTTTVNQDEAYWAREKDEVMAAGAAMRAHPRAAPAADANADAFADAARAEIEAAREAH